MTLRRPAHRTLRAEVAIVFGEGPHAEMGAGIVQSALARAGENSHLVSDPGERSGTFAGRVALLRDIGGRQLVVVSGLDLRGPMVAGPQSYGAAAEQLRMTHNLYPNPVAYLGVSVLDTNFGHVRPDELVLTGLAGNDPTLNILKMIGEPR